MNDKLLKVDIHTHIMPESMPRWADKFGYSGFIHLEHHKPCCARMMIDNQFFREIEANCWDPEFRLRDCSHHQVDVQVLSVIPVLFHYWASPDHAYETSRFFNDHIASVVQRYPQRFIGLGTLPMQSPALAIKELERCTNELGLAGIEIGSHINDWNLNDPALFEFYAAAEELGAALFIHPWDMMGKDKMNRYWLPWLVGMPAETSLAICSMIFGGIFERFPALKVAFAHGGGSFPATIGRIEHGFNVRPDLVAIDNPVNPRDYLGRFYLDSLVHDDAMLRYIVDLVGEDMIALGTDYPFPLGELSPGKLIEESSFTSIQKTKLLGTNALRWLGKKAEDYPLQY
jgi:aminocarboxymuconate-semialdehyde decarboxylase